jgi:hypothetical protein
MGAIFAMFHFSCAKVALVARASLMHDGLFQRLNHFMVAVCKLQGGRRKKYRLAL